MAKPPTESFHFKLMGKLIEKQVQRNSPDRGEKLPVIHNEYWKKSHNSMRPPTFRPISYEPSNQDLDGLVPQRNQHYRAYSQISLKKTKKMQSITQMPSSRYSSSISVQKKEPDYINLVNIYEHYLKPGTDTINKTLKKSKKILKKYNGFEFQVQNDSNLNNDQLMKNVNSLQ